MPFLLAIWDRSKGVLLAIGGILLAVLYVFSKGKSSGREQVVQEQREAHDEAVQRMEQVEPADSKSVRDSLRKGTF
jgi:hypothetical protein